MITEKPVVSIIIPCYNNQNFIGEAIESAINQTYENIEIIVVNDGSTDLSSEAINRFKEKVIIVNQSNKGAASARNRGLGIASGKYIKFLDGDDILVPESISDQVSQSLLHTDKHEIVYGIAGRMDSSGKKRYKPKEKHIDSNTNQVAFLLFNNYIITACPLHKKEYLDQYGAFDESLSQGEDPELHLRLCLAGIKFVFYPTLVYYYRQYTSSTRLSSLKWVTKTPELGLIQLGKFEELISKSIYSQNKETRTALGNRHFSYGRMFILHGNSKMAKTHISRAFCFIKWYQIKVANRRISGIIYFISYKLLGLSLTEKTYSSLKEISMRLFKTDRLR